MKVLIIGGTRFFGRRLVHQLIEHGHDVHVATRGNTADDFGDAVTRVRVDRTDDSQMKAAFEHATFDVVYDQVGFTPIEARGAVAAFGNRVGRYIYCSSMSVYDGKEDVITEADFDAQTYPVDLDAESYEYGEGKRQAEAYLLQNAPFPVVTVRVSMVVSGDDDYTGRFAFHVNHVAQGQSVGILPVSHDITYVTAQEVADFLYHLGFHTDFVGPVNAGNSGYLSAKALCERIGQILHKEPIFHETTKAESDADFSPYGFPVTLRASNELARSIGFEFSNWLMELPEMVRLVC